MELRIPLGHRVVVLSDLWLGANPSASARALTGDLAATLTDWEGPGVVVICGGLLDPAAPDLQAHPDLLEAMAAFTGPEDRRLILVADEAERVALQAPELRQALDRCSIELADVVEATAETAAGARRVVLRAGTSHQPPPTSDRPWLEGIERLERPELSERFVTSRLLYRRLGRYGWWLLIPVLVALLLRIPWVLSGLEHLFVASAPRRALARAHSATWEARLLTAAAITVVEILVLAAVLALLSRRIWVALGGERLARPWEPGDGSVDEAPPAGSRSNLDDARAVVADGATGLVSGGSLQAELVHLGDGFFAAPGATAELVRQHRGRLGLPPVFLHHAQSSFLELEAGADLHVRLVLADVDVPDSTRLERLATSHGVVAGHRVGVGLHPTMVASWPRGAIWPPPPDRTAEPRRARRVRRIAGFAILLTGLVDLLAALTPPLRDRLHLVGNYLPLSISEAAGALVALGGVALIMLARGIWRGQRRAWRVTVLLLAGTAVLHLVRSADVVSVVLSLAVLVLLVVERRFFQAATDRQATRSAVLTVVVGALAATSLGVVAIEVTGRIRREQLPSFPQVALGSAERLAGVDSVALPQRVQSFLDPAMLTAGVALLVVCLWLATRPVVDRGLSSRWAAPGRRAAEARARDLVHRHGKESLDYFALRDDKRWFFYRDSLVAYAVYGGICLVSPDPIGPVANRTHVWQAFRQYADRQGWGVAVMAAAEDWLPLYRETGMRQIYIGDEAIVDVRTFSLKGGHRKGLRQACTRLERYGYRTEFLDPAKVAPGLANRIIELMVRQRRGDAERGFSMCLSRIFDPRDTGLLLTVVFGPDGEPAAMCQFVPSPGIDGYSLDLMRRDPAEHHPNGLLDYALCSTIQHVRESGGRGLSLNFAAMRSILEGDRDGMTDRVERWVMRRLSGVFPIESLWRFNAKYDPDWVPRYIVFDAAERLGPAVAAIGRAESLSEAPVIGRWLSATTPAGPPPLAAPVPSDPAPPEEHPEEHPEARPVTVGAPPHG